MAAERGVPLVDFEALAAKGLINRKGGAVKLLGEGEAPKGLKVIVKAASAGARRKIAEAGGRVESPPPAKRGGRGESPAR